MNLFITNREIIKKGKNESIREDGGEHAGDNLRFGSYDTAKEQFNLFPEPADESETLYNDLLKKDKYALRGSVAFFREVYDELMKPDNKSGGIIKNDVLFFIHGFNTNLNGVREAYEHLNTRYVENPKSPVRHIIIFTWPGKSPAVPLHYFDDKKDAIRSGEALARGIEKVIRFFKEFLVNARNEPCHRKIHLMVHSMGHRVLKHMMLELKNNRIPIPDLFTEIVLMAADIEYDIFERDEAFNSLIDLGNRIHVYYNNNDRVLDISKYTKNFSNRLGRYGRKRIDTTLADVLDANVTSTKDDKKFGLEEKLLNHWYYYTSSEAADDIIEVLKGGKSEYIDKPS